MSYATLRLREKKVSVDLISTWSFHLFLFFPFFFNKCFLLAEMTTKFNKDMYVKMRSKKDESLSNIVKKTVRVTGKGPFSAPFVSITPIVFVAEMVRTASPTTSVEELPTPVSKRLRLSSKEKEKVDSRSSTIWDDETLAMDKAHGVVTAEDFEGLFWYALQQCCNSPRPQARSGKMFVQLFGSPFSFSFL